MVTPNWRKLDEAIAQMTEDEKLRLIERVQRSIPRRCGGVGESIKRGAEDTVASVVAGRQKEAWSRLRQILADAPLASDQTIVSEDYRRILYGKPEGDDQ